MKYINFKSTFKFVNLFLLFMLSCASIRTRDTVILKEEMDVLKDMVVDLRQNTVEQDMKQFAMENRVALLEVKVENLEANLSTRIDIEDVVSEQTADVEWQPEKELSPRKDEIDYRQLLEELIKLPSALLYKRGYDYVIFGDYHRALTVFKYFAEKYEDHELLDNVHYWMGECYYAVKDYLNALDEFQTTVEIDGNKVADALLKVGYTQAAIGKKDKALATLNEVIQRFPNTLIQRLAIKKIKKISDNNRE